MLAWEGLVLGFYSSLWFLPSRCLYRRPALHDYAAYQTVTRSLMVASLLMVWYRVDMGFCMELFGDTVLAGIGTPIMLFRALFQAHQPIPTSQPPPSPSTSTSHPKPTRNVAFCGRIQPSGRASSFPQGMGGMGQEMAGNWRTLRNVIMRSQSSRHDQGARA